MHCARGLVSRTPFACWKPATRRPWPRSFSSSAARSAAFRIRHVESGATGDTRASVRQNATMKRGSGSETLKAAVIGVGARGRYHAHKYAALSGVELCGVADIDENRAREISNDVGCRAVRDYTALLPEIDV